MSTILILVWMFMPLLAWAGNALFGRSCHGCLLFCLACLVGYGSMQAAVWAAEVELTADLGRYDRNGDGSFSRDEMTPDAQRAMEALARDTGRRLAPITGLPLTLVWYGFWFPVLIGTEKLVRRSFASDALSSGTWNSSTGPESGESLAYESKLNDDGNPCRPPK